MTVLGLFDGMSCGQLALQRAGIVYGEYYASEVDKWAIKVTQHHFPETIQLGDVRNVRGADLPKIDLLIGGSPCKGFSRAGNGLNFDHPESKLFFEYVRIWKEVQPTYWLLENVKMKKEWELEINKILGKRPIRFNSALVSAQTRERLYWTNIPVNDIPDDKKIFLKDIIEGGETELNKSYTIDSNYFKGGKRSDKPANQSQRRNMVKQINPSEESNGVQPYQQNRIYDVEGKSPALMAQLSGGSHKILAQVANYTNRDFEATLQINGNIRVNQKDERKSGISEVGTIAHICNKSSSIISTHAPKVHDYINIRKLTVKECCRLQTVPDNYFDGIVSNTQAYRMLGNGWTVDMIAFILSFMKPV